MSIYIGVTIPDVIYAGRNTCFIKRILKKRYICRICGEILLFVNVVRLYGIGIYIISLLIFIVAGISGVLSLKYTS